MILFSLKTIEALENGLQPQSGVTRWFSMRTVSLTLSQSCRSVDTNAWCKSPLNGRNTQSHFFNRCSIPVPLLCLFKCYSFKCFKREKSLPIKLIIGLLIIDFQCKTEIVNLLSNSSLIFPFIVKILHLGRVPKSLSSIKTSHKYVYV